MKNSKRVSVVLYKFIPQDNRVNKEIQFLKNNGFIINVYCLGYRDQNRIEKQKNLKINRVLTISDFNKRENILTQLLFWLLAVYYLLRDKTDIIHVHDPTALPPGFIAKLFLRKTVLIYDSHEVFPENARELHGFGLFLITLTIEVVSSLVIDYIISTSINKTKWLCKRLGKKKYFALPNYPKTEEIKILRRQKKDPNKIILTYSGSIQENRGYKTLINAISKISRNDIPYQFRIIGYGTLYNELLEMQESLEIPEKNLVLTGFKPKEDYLTEIANSHFGLILLKGKSYQILTPPTKSYEYLHGGCRIICSEKLKSTLETDGIYKNVEYVDIRDSETLALDLEKIISKSLKKNRLEFKKIPISQYNWDLFEESFIQFYSNL